MALDEHKGQPRAEDYPSSDGVPMDNEQHTINIRAWLLDPFQLWCEQTGFVAFSGGNSFVYYGPTPKADFVGPDLYVVNGGMTRGQEKWIVSLEGGLRPTLVMEFLWPKTRVHDHTTKLAIYRDKMGVLDYLLVDRGPVIRAFHLHGEQYVPVLPDAEGRFACSSLPLKVGVHEGWVRWFDLAGNPLPTRAKAERQQAEQEHRRAEEESLRADAAIQAAEQLRREVEALRAQINRSTS